MIQQKLTPITIIGKVSTATVFADALDDQARSQLQTLLDSEVSLGANIKIMPDVHAGMGCVIGYTAKMNGYTIPNLIGVDIGCGVLGKRLQFKLTDADMRQKFFEKLDKYIK
jgi:RNA-splicing ligase RtcB